MTLLGVLSLGQIVFLPGYLLLKALRLGTGIATGCILSFALSLVANHVLVAGLVVLGLYRPAVIYAIFAAELVLLLVLDRGRLRMGLREAVAACRRRTWAFLRVVEGAGNSERLSASLPSPSGRGAGGEGNLRQNATKGGAASTISPLPGPLPEGEGDRFRPFRMASKQNLPPLLRRLGLAVALLAIGGYAVAGIAQAGQIFQQWDAVVSWNRWAIDWAAGRLPEGTSIYPQLLPTNISLTYVFMQTSEIWFFAKGFQFLFCLVLLLAILDLARVEDRFAYVPGAVITYGLLVALLRFRMLGSGYVEAPVAFFATASVYVLFLARKASDERQRTKYLIVGALLAAGAASTKQIGLYVAAVHPLLAWRMALCGRPESLRKHVRLLLGMCLVICVFVLPWYVYKYFDFRAGFDSDNTGVLLVDLHEGRGLLERLLHAGGALVEALTAVGTVLLAIAVAASLREPLQRWFVGLFVVPLGLVWAIGFSYDLRNLAVIIPCVGVAAGFGTIQVLSRIAEGWRALHPFVVPPGHHVGHHVLMVVVGGMPPKGGTTNRHSRPRNAYLCKARQGGSVFLRVGHVAILSTLLLVAACLCVSDETLLARQRQEQRKVGIPELNSELYAYAAAHPDQAKIASDYQALRWLPELGMRSVACTCREFPAFRRTFERPDIRYVLTRKEVRCGRGPDVPRKG